MITVSKRWVERNGYARVMVYGDTEHGRKESEHIVIAERVLGKPLPAQAVVHHVNGIRTDNRNVNLVICENAKYHKWLHLRATAIKAGIDPNIEQRCRGCKEVKLLVLFGSNRSRWNAKNAYCGPCSSLLSKLTAKRKKESQ